MDSINEKLISRLMAKDWDAVFTMIENKEFGVNDHVFNHDGSKFTLLQSAVGMKRQDLVERLISMGADVNKIGGAVTPLMRACEAGQSDIVELLLTSGADVNMRTEKVPGEDRGETALVFAAEQGHLEVIKRLLAAGADVTCISARGRTALTAACERRCANGTCNQELIRLLVESGCPLRGTELHIPVFYRDVEMVKYLIAAGSDVNAAYPNNDFPDVFKGDAPILVAVRRNEEELAAAVGLKVPVKRNEKISIINTLILKGANVNTFGSKKYPPLTEAIVNEDIEVVEALLAAGADPSFGPHKPGSGKTSLEIAKDKKLLKIVKLLENATSKK